MPPVNLLIKPASGNCNLRCKYCFYVDEMEHREKSSYGFMSDDTLRSIIEKSLSYAEKECTIAFQGGEPTLCGLEFFRKVVEYEKQYNVNHLKINNVIQTNGYHLTDDWAEFFKQNHFLVGISLDGRKSTHNANRVNVAGNGTFEEIMNTIQCFNGHQVDYNILTVVNGQTAGNAKKIYDFYKKNNLNYLQFIPCLDSLEEETTIKEYSLTAELYGKFLCELFDCWYFDAERRSQPYIRMFDNYMGILMGYQPESCDMSGQCSIQTVIEADGRVYPCDFFVLDEFVLGNINEVSMEEIQKNRMESGFLQYSQTDHEQCKACEYYAICRGGCRRHRMKVEENGNHINRFCESYRQFFRYALPRMRSLRV